MCFSPQRRTIFQHLNFKKCSKTVSFLTFSLQNVLGATAACNFSTSQLQKVVRDRQFFNILTWKCASRPQRRAIFQHLNFKKWSEHVSLLAFSLESVLLATAACNFSTSQLQKVVRECSVLYILTSMIYSNNIRFNNFSLGASTVHPTISQELTHALLVIQIQKNPYLRHF